MQSPVNIHHVELFYHVARHGGISAATRKIPYGIQQPAVSGQILQLEKSLGLKLFQRRPFALTPAGRELFEFAQPFFGKIGEISRRLRSQENTRLRLAAPATILRGYLPSLIRNHQRKFPSLSLRLHDANQAEAERLLQKHEIDLAVTELEGKPAAGLNCAILCKLPLVLLLPARMKIKSAGELWQAAAPQPALVSLPPDEVMVKQFHARLRQLGVHWASGVEVSALDLVPIYVSLGLGIGLSLRVPGMKWMQGLRSVPLPGFPPLVVAALWQKNLSPANAAFLAQIRQRAEELGRQILE
ncbi:MAG: LysR family transcriptional regulator [Chthoniobacterales bacterium]|nr:LysR family transcriptional regulator [Chthoniobacterales bacterium]